MTTYSHTIILLLGIILVQNCGSSGNHQRSETGEAEKDTTVMNNDSVPPPPLPAPSPGHVRIRAQITGIGESGERKEVRIVSLKIHRIEAYGSSTPALTRNDTISVRTGKFTKGREKISAGKIVTAVISYQQAVLGSRTSPRWSLVQLD